MVLLIGKDVLDKELKIAYDDENVIEYLNKLPIIDQFYFLTLLKKKAANEEVVLETQKRIMTSHHY